MRHLIIFAVFIAATPAFAHHEVVAAASFTPLAWGIATITLAGLAAWRQRVRLGKR